MPKTTITIGLLLLALGCAPADAPPATTAAPAATPAPAPLPEPASALPPMPALSLAPRRSWRSIPVTAGGPITEAFAGSTVLQDPSGLRRVWLVMNLAAPIHMPETGGQARSVAYLADYQCNQHAWHPVQGIWYRDRNAVGEIVRDLPRGPDTLRNVREGTLIDLLVDAACGL